MAPPPLKPVTGEPADQTIAKATSQQFVATATLADGARRNLSNLVTWNSSDNQVAVINNLGLATGLETGTTTISAAIGALRGRTTLMVADAALEAIAVNPPDSEVVTSGGRAPLRAEPAAMNFPNETEEYRQAREELLQQEMALRAQIEKVAELRRELPLGGKLKEDYEFHELACGHPSGVKLSSLFQEHSTLLVHSFMFSDEMQQPCPMCTTFIDGVNSQLSTLQKRLSLAVVAKTSPGRLQQFGQTRGWQMRLLSCQKNSYNQDYHGEGLWNNEPSQIPLLNIFVKRADGIYHFWASEMQGAPSTGDPRHLDLAFPMWNLFDMTPEGRGEAFYPSLN